MLRHQRLGDRRRDRLEDDREAARRLQRERLLGDLRGLARAVLPWALKPPSAVAVCGVRPTWPITGIPARTIARARSTEAPPRSSLTASQPASLTKRWAFSIACSLDCS